MMHNAIRFLPFIGLALLSTSASAALISYAANGNTYSENFDSRVDTQQANTVLAWADDSTIPGWYGYHTGGGTGTDFITAGPEAFVGLRSGLAAATSGLNFWRTSATGPVYGTNATFGTQNFNGNTAVGQSLQFGFGLVNDTGETLTEFTLRYDAQIWSPNGTTTADDGYVVSYALGGTGVADAQGTFVNTSLGVTSLASTSGSATLTPGNPVNGSVTNITWLPGQTLFIRWTDPNVSGNDRGISIDNVQFTATPEPASLAGLAIGALLLKRRRAE